MHYYKFNIGDFVKDTAHLTLEEEGVYRRLIDLYYTSEKAISLDIKSVSRAIRARGNEDLISEILNEFFIKNKTCFKQTRIEKELKAYKEKSKKAKKSAEARWGKGSGVKENDANALRTQSERNANHKPLTTNHKPLTTNQEPVAKSKGRFTPPSNQEVNEYALEKSLALSGFHDYYESNGWRVGKNLMRDWKASARGWGRRNVEKNNGFSAKRNTAETMHDTLKQISQEADEREMGERLVQ